MERSLLLPVLTGGSISAIFLVAISFDPIELPAFAFLAIATVVMASINPLGAVAATTFTLPLFYQPLIVGTSEFASSELILLLAIPGAGIHIAFNFLQRRRSALEWLKTSAVYSVKSPLFISLLVLTITGGVLLNFLFYPDALSASFREWRWTLLEPLLYLVLLLMFARSTTARSVIAGFFLAGGLLLALLGLGDLISGTGVSGDSVRRISGPYPHPNAFSMYLMRPLVLALTLIAWSRQRRLWMLAIAGIGVISIVAAFSRAAFATLAIVFGVLSTRSDRKTQLVLFGVVVVATLTVLGLASDRMLSAFSGGSLSLRLEIWQSSLAMIRDRPVAGYGPDQFIYAYTPKYVSPAGWDERFTAHGHNLVIDYWIRLGIIGALFAASAVIIGLRAVATVAWGEGRKEHLLQSAAVITLGAAIFQALVDNGYFVQDLAMSAWLLAFLAFDKPAEISASTDLEI